MKDRGGSSSSSIYIVWMIHSTTRTWTMRVVVAQIMIQPTVSGIVDNEQKGNDDDMVKGATM